MIEFAVRFVRFCSIVWCSAMGIVFVSALEKFEALENLINTFTFSVLIRNLHVKYTLFAGDVRELTAQNLCVCLVGIGTLLTRGAH